MKEFIEKIAQALVDFPEAVTVDIDEENDVTNITLTVAKEDMGRIIGRKGQTANSMRTLLKAVGSRIGKKSLLEINESTPAT